jgi:hypothetical protein
MENNNFGKNPFTEISPETAKEIILSGETMAGLLEKAFSERR